MRCIVERTFLTTTDGRRSIQATPERFSIDAGSLSEAIDIFIERTNGIIHGCITETVHRAVCTGSSGGRLYLVVAEPAPQDGEPMSGQPT